LPGAVIFLLIAACGDATATTPSPSPTAGVVAGAITPTALVPPARAAQSTPIPLPTHHLDTAPWVEERVDTVVALYQPTEAGEALLRSLDLRQMKGDPGFFGSYGFNQWAGVGEASPIGVMHELGHSYWGGFPVETRPDLSWDIGPDSGLSTAMKSYHRDILAFMAQPPDEFELLRQRLRNLPDISSENTEPVFHNLEADMVYNTAGSLNLVPPILRKYWSSFLPAGRFDDWYGAAGWFQSLSPDEVSATGKWLGFEHLDLRQYPLLDPATPPEKMILTAQSVLATEEQERLRDLAYGFDLLVGDPQKEENFEFWRRYLRDKVTLYQAHPDYLAVLSISRAGQIESALKFLADPATDSPVQQAQHLASQLVKKPFLVNFLPAVDNEVLVELFSSGAALPESTTLQATASFVERLKVFGAKVDSVLQIGRTDPSQGATELEKFIAATGFDQKDDLRLFFDLFRDSNRTVAKNVTLALSDETVRGLMMPVPFQLRSYLEPSDLLPKLGITSASPDAQAFKEGIAVLIGEPSGSYQVDEPFLDALYQVMAERAEDNALDTAQLILDSPFPLEGMILAQPEAAATIFRNNIEIALSLATNSDSILAPPWRIIYRLIKADPSLAAEVLVAFHRGGESRLVAESLAYLAYDKERQELSTQLPVSLEQDGRFLGALLQSEGTPWLEARLGESVDLYRQRVEDGEVSNDFLESYRETLEFAAAFLSAGTRTALTGVIRRAFGLS
tara:strand:+ start:123 stop:2330 length:2208 start_codon:yes stop_codon:yes gene_type:complete